MNQVKIPKRRQWYVDQSVQKTLVKHLFYYILACLLFVTLPATIWSTLNNTDRNITTHLGDVLWVHGPILLAIIAMIPFAVYDMILISNRFAGPVFRLRRELKTFAETGKMKEVFFRENDFWQDLALGVNRLTNRIEELESQLANQKSEPAREPTI